MAAVAAVLSLCCICHCLAMFSLWASQGRPYGDVNPAMRRSISNRSKADQIAWPESSGILGSSKGQQLAMGPLCVRYVDLDITQIFHIYF